MAAQTAKEIAQKLAGMNTDEVFDQLFTAIIAPMLDSQSLPAKGMEMIKERLLAKHTQTLRDGYAEQYERLFNADELAAILAWVESPVGVKFRELTPQIAQESFAAGQQVAIAIIEEIESEGLMDDLFDDDDNDDLPPILRMHSDDTSLGAELLDEICPDDGKSS